MIRVRLAIFETRIGNQWEKILEIKE